MITKKSEQKLILNNHLKGGAEDMDSEIIETSVKRTIFKDTCNYCGREIKGTSESSVTFNMDLHKKTQHSSDNQNAKK